MTDCQPAAVLQGAAGPGYEFRPAGPCRLRDCLITMNQFLVFTGFLAAAVLGRGNASPVAAPDLAANPTARERPRDPKLPTLFIAGDSTAAKNNGGPWNSFLSAKGRAVPADPIGWLNLPEPANPALPTLLLIGDSTVRNGCGDGSGGQWGWGDELAVHFDTTKINVVNRAVGGLSSRTFLTQGHWARALNLLKPGDFVLMQFGHNDDGPVNDDQRARGTIKGAGEETQEIDNLLTKQHEVVHSYGWYLRQYIREAKTHGALPIVCSPVPRKVWQDGKIVRSAGGYAGWARQIAAEEGAAFIDLNDLVAQRYEALGAERVEAMFADAHTHTSQSGAELTAAIVTASLRELPGGRLAPYLRGP